MDEKDKSIDYYLTIIDEIEKVRKKNNVNWMDILRIAITYAPDKTKKVLVKNLFAINQIRLCPAVVFRLTHEN